MTHINFASLNGNPVASNLEVNSHDCKLTVKSFPTEEFVCRHMHQTLKNIIFPNQSITMISRCIGSFNQLESLILPYNNLESKNGIPSTILDLSNKTLTNLVLDVRGNENINRDFSWENEYISNEDENNAN